MLDFSIKEVLIVGRAVCVVERLRRIPTRAATPWLQARKKGIGGRRDLSVHLNTM